MGLVCAVLADHVMRRMRQRHATWTSAQLFMAAWASVLCFEAAMELIAVRTQLVAYPSAIHDLSLWAGTRYQLPVYEMVAWSLVLTVPGWLRHRHFQETNPPRSPWVTARRALAIVGLVNVVALSYDVAMVATSLYAGRTVVYPTYFRTGQCGPGTTIECPGPDAPIVTR
jgi:hypothetical protein